MATIDKNTVERHFDESARTYDSITPVQSAMRQRLLTRTINAVKQSPRRVLEIGCGTGTLTSDLAKRYPNAHITAMDISKNMIERARNNTKSRRNIEWVHADAETRINRMRLGVGYDLIVSNATLQWFSAPLMAVKKLASLLSRNGVLGFSTFGPRTFDELRRAFRNAETRLGIGPIPRVQFFEPLRNWRESSSACSHARFRIDDELITHYYNSVPEFLHVIKKSGASYASNRASNFMGKRLYRTMINEYQSRFSVPDGRIRATYEVIYGIVVQGD